MKIGKFGTLSDLAREIQRQHQAKKDYVASTEFITVYPPDENRPNFRINAGIPDQGVHALTLDELALMQMATKSEIPRAFQKTLIEKKEQPLYAHILNELHRRHPAKRMIRALDGHARAFLSDAYKRIDNTFVLQTILPSLQERGDELRVESCDLTGNNMYLKVVSNKLEAKVVGDTIQAGFVISNSEVGLGSWKLRILLYTLDCMNGMIGAKDVGHGIDRRHIGARQSEGVLYREDTIAADQKAFALQVRDTLSKILSEENFLQTIEMMRAASHRKMTKTADPSKVVLELGREVGFNQTEGAGIMQHLIQGGDLSQYGLANAVTRYAQDDEVTYDRSTELEMVGSKIVDLNGRRLERILEAA